MNLDELVQLERDSIRAFVESVPFKGRVLDLGAGRQPYRSIVEATGATYHPWDRVSLPACMAPDDVGLDNPLIGTWDAILCTQVIQFVPRPFDWLVEIRYALRPGGLLAITGPTNWPEINHTDLHRLTWEGARNLLDRADYRIDRIEPRATIPHGGFDLSLGWAAVTYRR